MKQCIEMSILFCHWTESICIVLRGFTWVPFDPFHNGDYWCVYLIANNCRPFRKKCVEHLLDSSYPSVCLSVRMKQLDSDWTVLHDTLYWRVLLKYVDIIQFRVTSDKYKGTITWTIKKVIPVTGRGGP